MRSSSFAPGNVGVARVLKRLKLAADLSDHDIDLVHTRCAPAAEHVTGALLDGHGAVLAEGWACSARLFTDGRRQILGFILPGDPVELGHEASGRRYCTMALTRGSTIDLSGVERAVAEDRTKFSALAEALELCRRRRVTRALDHLTRLSALTAYEAMGDLLLELHGQSVALGLSEGDVLALPISQDVLGEALGLSGVHTNRTLAKLRKDGLIDAGPGWMKFPNPANLHAAARAKG
jgi:CRP-like cAMP-binding protein